MINITLPDGAIRQYESGTTALQIAQSISEGLARNVLGAKINGEGWDSNRPITADSKLQLLSWNDLEGKEMMWHSSAHCSAASKPSSTPIRNRNRRCHPRGSSHSCGPAPPACAATKAVRNSSRSIAVDDDMSGTFLRELPPKRLRRTAARIAGPALPRATTTTSGPDGDLAAAESCRSGWAQVALGADRTSSVGRSFCAGAAEQ